ncbi:pectinesterase family protein [Streptomyces sp. NPDC004539]|uniref:pectinesterase family protein n=1 Tax=Streptomyces sp. NPDC004539 TaxID=3154280 RepID=UPI0033AAF1EA
MSTEARGGLPRRSILAAMVAAGVVTGAGGLVLAGARSAVAAQGADISWQITSEPADARVQYATLINGIRQAVSDHRVRPDGGRPVDVTASDGTNQFITVDLQAEDRPEFLRLFVRRSDAYILGFRPGATNGEGTVQLADAFFTLEAGVQLPGATATNTQTRFNGHASYSSLPTRNGMQISPTSLNNAVLTLHNASTVKMDDAEPALLQLIVALAEGARFREQAAETATAFGRGLPFTVTPQHMDRQNNWARASTALLGAIALGEAVLTPEIEIGEVVYATVRALTALLMLAHHSGKNTRGRGLAEGTTSFVAADGTGDHRTVQSAIDAAPSGGSPYTVFVDKGDYHEVITVPANRRWLTLMGVTGVAEDVVVHNTRAHGMLKPDGTQWGTEGSAVATFKAPDLTVRDLTVSNTFDPVAHPEVDEFETQAVAVAAKGDRQVYRNVRILGRQDTLLVKGETPTTEARQYFVECFIRGSVDFVFGNATAVIDRSTLHMLPWPGGTILAPNTDSRKKYGILVTGCTIASTALPRTMYLGRPWHNAPEVQPQAVVRDTLVAGAVNDPQPWTDMTPDYHWSQARFREFDNSGLGAGQGANAPKLTAAEAADHTAEKYLAGSDRWNPLAGNGVGGIG